MRKVFEVEVQIERLPLSQAMIEVFNRLERYDCILFTSKHSVSYFLDELHERQITFPKTPRIIVIGLATAEVLYEADVVVHDLPEVATVEAMIQKMGNVAHKNILYPRSNIAPLTPVRMLREGGAHVTTMVLYKTEGVVLSVDVKKDIINGVYAELYFKSPSGVTTFMKQFSTKERVLVRQITAICIGPTTEAAAKEAGCTNVRRAV